LPICFYDELGCTRIVGMNWDFVAIFSILKSGTNRRLWDRTVTGAVQCSAGEKKQLTAVVCLKACEF